MTTLDYKFPAQADVAREYGRIEFDRDGLPTTRWQSRCLISVGLPYPMQACWNPELSIKRALLHRQVFRSCQAALGTILTHFGGIDNVTELGLNGFGGAYQFGINNFGFLNNDCYGIVFRIKPPKDKVVPQDALDIFKSFGWAARGGLKPGACAVFEAVSKD